ncbi:MAG: hypothetical protein ABI612_04365 [Betaproteobacteria bacterium]
MQTRLTELCRKLEFGNIAFNAPRKIKHQHDKNATPLWQYFSEGERHLNIRAFSDNMRREAYERQKGVCVKCKNKFQLGRNGRRSHQALAREQENQCGHLPDAGAKTITEENREDEMV